MADRHGYNEHGPVLASEQGPTTRTGFNKTGEEKFDEEGRNFVDELWAREGDYGFSLHQVDFARFGEEDNQSRKRNEYQEDSISNALEDGPIPRLRCDLAAPEPPIVDHHGSSITGYTRRMYYRRDENGCLVGRHEPWSGWWPDGPRYGNNTAKGPITITPPTHRFDTEPGRSFHGQLVVDTLGIYAGLKLTNDQYLGTEHRERFSNSVRFCYNQAADKGVFTGKLYNQIDLCFLPEQMLSQGLYGSTLNAEISGSDFTSHSVSKTMVDPIVMIEETKTEPIATDKLDLLGRDRMYWWKNGPGHNKDWRPCRYVKSVRKGERAKYQLLPSERRSSLIYLYPSKAASHHLAITQSPHHIAVPKGMLRQKPPLCQGNSSNVRPKSSWEAVNEVALNKKTIVSPKSRARWKPWMTNPIDLMHIEEAWTPDDRVIANSEISNETVDDLVTAMASPHSETSSTKLVALNAESNSVEHLLAYESFTDTILGTCLRLKRLVRTKSHYGVYYAESLSDGNQEYEVRAYNLRRLSVKERNYKIRNLKRASARSSCIGSLDQGGKRWLVFTDTRLELTPEPVRDYGPLWRTKEEYDRAFPVLEPQNPYNSDNSEDEPPQNEAVAEAFNARVEKALTEEPLKNPGIYQVIDEPRELLVTSFNSCHHYKETTSLSEERKKIKSPEQEKRLRDRHRLSRQTKGRAKAALKTVKTLENGVFGDGEQRCCYQSHR